MSESTPDRLPLDPSGVTEPVQTDSASENAEADSVASDRMLRCRDVFGSFHFTIESMLAHRDGEPGPAMIERMAASSLDRTHALINEFLGSDDVQDDMSVDELTVHVVKMLCEDFLCRADPILNGEPTQETN